MLPRSKFVIGKTRNIIVLTDDSIPQFSGSRTGNSQAKPWLARWKDLVANQWRAIPNGTQTSNRQRVKDGIRCRLQPTTKTQASKKFLVDSRLASTLLCKCIRRAFWEFLRVFLILDLVTIPRGQNLCTILSVFC